MTDGETGRTERLVYKYSRTGRRHIRAGQDCQDAVSFAECGGLTAAALADGVSTCAMSKEGAKTAADAAAGLLCKRGRALLEYREEDIAEIATSHVLFELDALAAKDGRAAEEYSSTLAAALFDRENRMLLLYNLGDCIIFAIGDGKCRIAAGPYDSTDGCCTTTTEGAASAACVRKIRTDNTDCVLMCSDGAWRHMVNGGRLMPEIEEMAVQGRFAELEGYLKQCCCDDDSSFVVLETENGEFQ